MNNNISVGAVFSRVFDIYGKRLGLLIGMAAVVFIPAAIIRAILGEAGIIGSLLASIVSMVAAALYTGAVVRVVQAEDGGSEPGSIGEVFGSVKDRLWPLIWVGLLAGIATGIGFILIIIPGLFLLTIWAVFEPVIVVEGKGLDSLSRSRELVKGNGWNVFGVIVCAFLILFAIGILGGIFGGIIGGVVGIAIFEAIFAVLLVPVVGLIHAVLYFNLLGAGGAAGQAQAS